MHDWIKTIVHQVRSREHQPFLSPVKHKWLENLKKDTTHIKPVHHKASTKQTPFMLCGHLRMVRNLYESTWNLAPKKLEKPEIYDQKP